MLGDLTEKISGGEGKLEELANKIPGYAGYKAKEQRRDADKLLRMHVARQFEEEMTRLDAAQLEMVEEGELRAMMILERASTKLQLLIDRIKTASYGYAGLFDAVKVDEAALDRLYDFDQGLLSGVNDVAALLDEIESALANDDEVRPLAKKLVAALQDLNTTFSERQDVVLAG